MPLYSFIFPFLDLYFQYISLPSHTSVSSLSKRHAHKILWNDRFQNSDFVFGQLKPVIILFAHAAKKNTKPCKSRRQRYILKIQIQKENFFIKRKKDSGRTAVFFEKVFLLGYSKKLCNVLGGYKYILTNIWK